MISKTESNGIAAEISRAAFEGLGNPTVLPVSEDTLTAILASAFDNYRVYLESSGHETLAPLTFSYATCNSGGGEKPTVTLGFETLSEAQSMHGWLIHSQRSAVEPRETLAPQQNIALMLTLWLRNWARCLPEGAGEEIQQIIRVITPEEPRETTTPHLLDQFTEALKADPDLAWSWHCNLAMPIMDRVKCSHTAANEAAADLMRHLFRIDIRSNSCWAITVRPEEPSGVQLCTCADGARYRFLREPNNAIVYARDPNAWGLTHSGHVSFRVPEELDAAIDKVRVAEKASGNQT
jgi:hypothetical protein